MTPKGNLKQKERDLRALVRKISKTKPASPASIYRLQINPQFNFKQALATIPYLKSLGVEALYVSPYFATSPGSLHGYDVVNPNQINPDLGSPEDYENFVRGLKAHGLKQIFDMVPNHMGILGNKNIFWQDVLENGPSSIYAKFFDIDWDPAKKELKDKVLIPILGDHIGRVLERKEIQLFYQNGEFQIRYWSHELPVAPKTYALILEYGIEKLKHELKTPKKVLKEFLSTITALKNLPPRNETNPDLILERNREKEIAKGRLDKAYRASEEIRNYIQSRLEIFNGRLDDPASFDLLEEVLNAQAYRMAYWRVAAEEINYRRFFDINELAAICMEDDEVFEVYHQLLFQMIREGNVQGLRIDHPDGLYDPPDYFRKLQKHYMIQEVLNLLEKEAAPAPLEDMDQITRELHRILDEPEFRDAKPFLVVAEKILDRKENLPEDWGIHGTVGYDYLNNLNGLFVQRENEAAFDEFYSEFVGDTLDFEQMTYDKKKFIALVHMGSEINHLAMLVDSISEQSRRYRDFTVNNFAVAIREIIACFPVYRTYIRPTTTQVSDRDAKYIHIAVEKAKRKTPALSASLYDFLRDILLLKLTAEMNPDEEKQYRNFILRFQQLTGPMMAKGLEDTAFYIYNRFISLNEVGGSPTHFGVSIGDFHKQNVDNRKFWPNTFVASSTHDTKRSEDVRMRLNVLSEIPEQWKANVIRWLAANEKHKIQIGDDVFPDRNTEYFIYQTLVGVWPHEELSDEAYAGFIQRIWSCVQKSIREAKIFTNWVNPNEDYENAIQEFVENILARQDDNYFLNFFLPFQKRVAQVGMLNSISGTLLKLGSPGIVDTYQGNEMWNFSLVDPDNRRKIDYQRRQRALEELGEMASAEDLLDQLLTSREDGRLKLYLTWKTLNFRKENRRLFLTGDYTPLQVVGAKKNNVIAYLRKYRDKMVLVAAARFFHHLYLGLTDEAYDQKISLHGKEADWQDTAIVLPQDMEIPGFQDILTGKRIATQGLGSESVLNLSQLFSVIGVAMCTPLK